jgi:hypothetical protein
MTDPVSNRDGQIIENVTLIAPVVIAHNNVTIRNCRIVRRELPGEPVILITSGKTGALIEDCEEVQE